jgi:hypothetical protein
MIAAAAILNERLQRRSTIVRVLSRYCCQALKAFIHFDFRIGLSSKYQWTVAEI